MPAAALFRIHSPQTRPERSGNFYEAPEDCNQSQRVTPGFTSFLLAKRPIPNYDPAE
jgi:hypothetical protein